VAGSVDPPIRGVFGVKINFCSTSTAPTDHRRRLRRPRRYAQQRRAAGARAALSGPDSCQRRGEGRRVCGSGDP